MPIMIRKKYGYTVSSTKGSNKVVACAKVNWGALREGSFISISGDSVFYKIANKRKFLYTKQVKVSNDGNRLIIDHNIGNMLGSDDEVSFTNKEYKIKSASVSNGGSGYQVDDILRIDGGTPKLNPAQDIDNAALLRVAEVDENGSILSLELSNEGVYYIAPESSCNALSGSGTSAVVVIEAELLDSSPIEARSVTIVELSSDQTVIHLNHALPPDLSEGEIKTEKWELTLDSEYVGESKFNVAYEVVKDFTPNYDLPLIYGDLASSHLLYNEAMALIDKRFKDIEDRLDP